MCSSGEPLRRLQSTAKSFDVAANGIPSDSRSIFHLTQSDEETRLYDVHRFNIMLVILLFFSGSVVSQASRGRKASEGTPGEPGNPDLQESQVREPQACCSSELASAVVTFHLAFL